MKHLSELVIALKNATLQGDGIVTGLAHDSRAVQPGDLYVCVVGDRFDGHGFAADAVGRGAAALVVQADRADTLGEIGLPRIVVPSTRRALAPLACAFYDNPTRDLVLAGVTGTNGKTTTVRMIDSIARVAGDTTGMVGTLGATVAGRELNHDRTTPEAPELQALFARMRAADADSAAIEVASHALVLERTAGCLFDVVVFTNLTQDHLDFHQTMEAYRDAKGLLFTEYAEAARRAGKKVFGVLNIDDEAGRHFAAVSKADEVLTYSPSGDPAATLYATDLSLAVDRIQFTARTPSGGIPVVLPFGGDFNVANALAAIGYGMARRFAPANIAAGLADCPPVPGRFQPVRAGQEFAVLVDYAHTPDGLENVLRAARPLTPGRLIAVFGCGGNRDRTKRPIMGRLAGTLSDIAVVTSDNPRREEPDAIVDDILAGMDGVGAQVIREVDRRAAIRKSVRMAKPGDTIVLAGKGHEDYQEIEDVKHPFSDVEVAREEIQAWRGH